MPVTEQEPRRLSRPRVLNAGFPAPVSRIHMTDELRRILVIEADGSALECLVDGLLRRFCADVTCVASAKDGLDQELVHPCDAVIASYDTPDLEGAELARHLSAISRRPVILTASRLRSADALELMRLGIRDVFIKPFPLPVLLECLGLACQSYRIQLDHQRRHAQLRNLVKRLIRQRRQSQERMDLVCRDLVGAHRKLVTRVLEFEERAAGG